MIILVCPLYVFYMLLERQVSWTIIVLKFAIRFYFILENLNLQNLLTHKDLSYKLFLKKLLNIIFISIETGFFCKILKRFIL
jgi:hypothetical protein